MNTTLEYRKFICREEFILWKITDNIYTKVLSSFDKSDKEKMENLCRILSCNHKEKALVTGFGTEFLLQPGETSPRIWNPPPNTSLDKRKMDREIDAILDTI